MTIHDIRERLKTLAEPRFQAFAASLIPGETRLLGVRLPKLRALAKELSKGGDILRFAAHEPESMEEIMLSGMLPGYAPACISYEARMDAIRQFVPRIDNWSICDSCCATYKFVRRHLAQTWDFLQPYLHSEHEFEARFGIVMLLNHFMQDATQIKPICDLLPHLPCSGYYAEMAAAWLICEIHLRYPSFAHHLLACDSAIRPSIRSRCLRKIRESRRKNKGGKA